jgi:hypothetical protein
VTPSRGARRLRRIERAAIARTATSGGPPVQARPAILGRRLSGLSVAMILAACGTGDGASATPSAAPSLVPTTPDPDDALARLLDAYAGSGDPSTSPIQETWATVLGGELAAPAAVLAYGPGEVPGFACRDQLPADDWAGNAFYCPADASIAYDLEFIRPFHEAIGPEAAVAILAHEWGHHVQRLTGSGAFSIQAELQADCFAGVFASAEDLESGNTVGSADAVVAFYELGNEEYSATSWFSLDEHGSPYQRFAAWSLGYLGPRLGYEFCRGYDRWSPGQTVDLGPFSMVQLPGREGTLVGETYTLDDPTLGTLTVRRVSTAGLAGATVDELLASWIDADLGASLGVMEGPFHAERPDEYAFAYVAAEPDAATATYARHGIIGLQLSPADPGHALVIEVPAAGTPPVGGTPTPEHEEAALDAAMLALMAAERVCAPHHTTDGVAATHNEMCFPDL